MADRDIEQAADQAGQQDFIIKATGTVTPPAAKDEEDE